MGVHAEMNKPVALPVFTIDETITDFDAVREIDREICEEGNAAFIRKTTQAEKNEAQRIDPSKTLPDWTQVTELQKGVRFREYIESVAFIGQS